VRFEENACPACGSVEMRTLCRGTDRLFDTTKKSFLVVECSECRLLRLYPWPEPSEVAGYYPEEYWYDPTAERADQLADIWRRLVLRDHLRFVRRALDSTGLDLPVLDVGCGGGLFLRELGLPQERIVGLDFSVNAASVAWNTNGVPAACAALPRAPFRPRSFGVITMFHVLEHLYDPIAYVNAAKELLHPGGRLIVQVPNADCWQFLLLGERWNGLDIPRHLIDFRAKDIEDLLVYCGFEIVRRKHFSLRDNPAGLASSLAPRLDPMSRRVRRVPDSPGWKLFKDLVYAFLVVAAIPFTLLEAACRAGSTIMLEARLKAGS
jgi:2-polyprenyl-3-methyl-5-hydroxy-6-metoxy-1,4-benzoquinol methylase/predicted nucleic-acid-binding Zn-ribbon protein